MISCSQMHKLCPDPSDSTMGKLLSKVFGNREIRILMLGLDAAGKTSILFVHMLVFQVL